jgi:Sap, sulfolipid-1-addressing protein
MLLEATGLALLAAISPTALLIASVFLGSAQPRRAAAFYLTGAVVMSLVMGLVTLVVLRGVGLEHPGEHGPRYGLRLGLGALMVVGAAFVGRRRTRRQGEAESPQGWLYRMAAQPSPTSAFVVGILVFAPGAAFLAAIQVIATARASVDLTALAVVIVVALNVLLVWLPIVFHLLAPEATTRWLTSFNGWLRANGQAVLVWVLLVVGCIMVGNGIYGLAVIG